MTAPAVRWAALQAELRGTEAAYRAAAHARDVFVLEGRSHGLTWGQLAELTGLDRGQLVRMARRAESGNESR